MIHWQEKIPIFVLIYVRFSQKCSTQWTENEEAVSRAIEIWGDRMMRVMEKFESLAQSKRQKKTVI